MLFKLFKIPMAYLGNIIKQNWAASAMGSGLLSFVVDWLQGHSLGSIVGVIIFGCTGFYSIKIAKLKSIEKKNNVDQNLIDKKNEVAHKQRMRDLEYQQKKQQL